MAISHQNKFQVGRAVADSVIYSSLVLVLLRCTFSSALAFACSRILEYPRLCAALCIELLLVLVLAVVVLVLVRSFFAGCHVHVYARVFSRPAGMSSCEAVVRTGKILGPPHISAYESSSQNQTSGCHGQSSGGTSKRLHQPESAGRGGDIKCSRARVVAGKC